MVGAVVQLFAPHLVTNGKNKLATSACETGPPHQQQIACVIKGNKKIQGTMKMLFFVVEKVVISQQVVISSAVVGRSREKVRTPNQISTYTALT